MILAEPPPSPGDLHFRIGPFPVRIHPFFWLVALVLGLGIDNGKPKSVLLWMGVVLISIVVHELGHAVLQRWYGGNPRIVLYGMGGLAISNEADRSVWSSILISLAGPVAGFLFAGLIVALAPLLGADLQYRAPWEDSKFTFDWYFPAPLFIADVAVSGASHPLALLVALLLQVNVLWGLINLLPIYPLDGGRVSRDLMTVVFPPRIGIIRSLWLSVVCAGVMAIVLGLTQRSLFNVILFGLLAYSSYQTLVAYRDQGNYSSWR